MPLAVSAAEAFVCLRYAAYGVEFHYWLHGLFGAALGFLVVAALRLAGRRPPVVAVWVAGLLAHLLSATPDALYLNLGWVHVRWMDVFAFHVSIHFVDQPLLVALSVFVGALAVWGAAILGRRLLALSGAHSSSSSCSRPWSPAHRCRGPWRRCGNSPTGGCCACSRSPTPRRGHGDRRRARVTRSVHERRDRVRRRGTPHLQPHARSAAAHLPAQHASDPAFCPHQLQQPLTHLMSEGAVELDRHRLVVAPPQAHEGLVHEAVPGLHHGGPALDVLHRLHDHRLNGC